MTNFEIIKNKVYNNIRLSDEDGLFLFSSNDILTLGELAGYKNFRINGNNVYYKPYF